MISWEIKSAWLSDMVSRGANPDSAALWLEQTTETPPHDFPDISPTSEYSGTVFKCLNWATLKEILTDGAFKSFSEFMYGQTQMLDNDRVAYVYSWDFERWLANPRSYQTLAEWD